MTEYITIRFYADLNDLLPPGQRGTESRHNLLQPRSVKDLIESTGVPHTEIELIIVDGKSVDFTFLLKGGEHISVYPAFTSLDISPIKRCRVEELAALRFVLDNHLGKLAAYLRMLGFDTLYRNDYADPELADIATSDDRILLTCDRQLLMRNQVTHGYFVRSRDSRQQLYEINRRYDLVSHQQPFTRCMECNGEIHAVTKADVEPQLMPDAKKYYDRFFQCTRCRKIYWEGSHYQKMKSIIDNINSNSGFYQG